MVTPTRVILPSDLLYSRESILEILSTVADPEIPVISIVDLGIVRDVTVNDQSVVVKITPTYSGCPAMAVIEQDIREALSGTGIPSVVIETQYAPAWTTEWISEEAKLKLNNYGIAPPVPVLQSPVLQIELPTVACPFCHAADTRVTSEFGSTPCKSYYYCTSCRQPFEHFKSF